MAEGDPVEAQYDATRVMFNGAAIALVTNLTNGIQSTLTAEIKAAEQRQNDRLDTALVAITGDVDSLELWRADIENARLVRQGQMSVLTGLGRFLARYDKVILGVGLGLAAAVATFFGLNAS